MVEPGRNGAADDRDAIALPAHHERHGPAAALASHHHDLTLAGLFLGESAVLPCGLLVLWPHVTAKVCAVNLNLAGELALPIQVTSTKIVDFRKILPYVGTMITPEQCRAARAWLGWSQEELAERAKVALSTVRDFEKDRREPIANNLDAIQSVLENAGIAFFSQALGPAGVQYEGRIKESDTYFPVLELLDDVPGGFMKTADLIKALEDYFAPKGEDAEILAGRSDTKFSQIVRNIVSHRDSPSNLIGAGWAEYDRVRRGLRITTAGRFHLQQEQERRKREPYSRA